MSRNKKHVILIDDDSKSAAKLKSTLDLLGYASSTLPTYNGLAAVAAQAENPVLVLAKDTPDFANAKDIARALAEAQIGLPLGIIQDSANFPEVPDALESRVISCLRPGFNYKELLGALNDAELYQEYKPAIREDYSATLYRSLIGSSRDMNAVRQLIRRVASTDATVLIQGESGTGKEVAARNIHEYSRRAKKPFVPVNCGAIPADLLESELFGHEKGAFTGAFSARQGRFELAQGGTLFLDEIGDMPLNMQVKLLRVLQEHSFERVGSNTPIKSDVRIIAATHQQLEKLVDEGKFRLDLYYRLNVFPIEMPPLRRRKEDIPLLIKGIVNRMEQNNHHSVNLDAGAQAVLSEYAWPGNVRELFNLIERLSILYPEQEVAWPDLPEKFRPEIPPDEHVASHGETIGSTPPKPSTQLPDSGVDLKTYLADLECELMRQALESTDWVVARAAKLLNLQRTTLVEKMRKYGIHRPEDVPEN